MISASAQVSYMNAYAKPACAVIYKARAELSAMSFQPNHCHRRSGCIEIFSHTSVCRIYWNLTPVKILFRAEMFFPFKAVIQMKHDMAGGRHE